MSSRANSKAKTYWRCHASTEIRNLNPKALLNDTAVSTRAVIIREQQSKSTYGAAISVCCPHGQHTNGYLAQPWIIHDQQFKPPQAQPRPHTPMAKLAPLLINNDQQSESIPGRHGGVHQSGNETRAAQQKHKWRTCISTSRYIAHGQQTNA